LFFPRLGFFLFLFPLQGGEEDALFHPFGRVLTNIPRKNNTQHL
jgi:hypothetical protein